MTGRSSLPVWAAAGTGVLVGLATAATRFVIDQTDPASLALLRYTIGFLCLAPAALAASKIKFDRRDVLPISTLGIIQFGVLIYLLNHSLRYIPASRAALIFSAVPLLTMVIGAIFGRERMTTAKTAGVILTVVGVGLALGEKAFGAGGGQAWIGELFVGGSVLCGALTSVLYRPYLGKYPTARISSLAMLASCGLLALLAAGEGFFNTWPRFTVSGWAAVVFIGVNSGVGYYLWLWALKNSTPTRVTAFLGLGPITAALVGAVFLQEVITTGLLLGLACVVSGLWLAHRQAAPAGRADRAHLIGPWNARRVCTLRGAAGPIAGELESQVF